MNNGINLEGKIYVAGARGYSNYEIAVQNGFIGTEEEWLQTMFDYAGNIASAAVLEKIVDGTFLINLINVYDSSTQELTIGLDLENGGGE